MCIQYEAGSEGGHIPFTDLQQVQIELGIIDLAGTVDAAMAYYVRHAISRFQADGNPNITVNISSAGGNTHYGLAIYDMLRIYKGEKSCIVTDEASSAATIILQACTKRIAARHSVFLIHPISLTDVKMQQLYGKKFAKLKKQTEMLQRAYEGIIAVRTRKSMRRIRNVCRKNTQMNAEQALKFGFIDEII